MSWSQTLVVSWLQFACTSTLLLLIAQVAMRWIVQPAERIRLIQSTIIGAFAIPLLMALAPWPACRLQLLPSAHPVVAVRTDSRHGHEQLDGPQTNTHRPPLADHLAMPADKPRANDADAPASLSRAASASWILPQPSKPTFDRWSACFWILAAVNLLVAAYFFAEWLIGKIRLHRLVRQSFPVPSHVVEAWNSITAGRGQQVRLLASGEIATPLTFGWWRPVVVIPQQIAQAGSLSLRFCLAHEWSHIERADIVTWRALWVCQFALWYQPLYWKLRRELRICQDMLADVRSTESQRDAVEYSELLLGFARKRLDAPLAGALGFLDQPSQLARRIKMLLQRSVLLKPACTLQFSLAAGVATLLLAVLLSSVRLDTAGAQEANQTPAQQTATEDKPTSKDSPPEGNKDAPSDVKEATTTASESANAMTYHCVILDKATGKGIPDATVVVRRSNLTSRENRIIEESTHTTDADGKYSFEIPAEQAAMRYLYIELDVDHHDYAAKKGFGYALSMILKNEKLGERPFFERVELNAAEPVTGKLLSPDGQPLAGVKLLGYSKESAKDFRDYGSFTDTVSRADGKFRLNLVKGGEGVFWILPKDYAIVQKYAGKKRGDQGEIRLQPGIRVTGRVMDVEGKPLAGVAVNIDCQDGEDLGGLPVATSVRRGALSGNDGQFSFDPLPPGSYRVIPEEHRNDPLQRDRTIYSVPGVFLPVKVALKEATPVPPLEVQAVPHVVLHAQYFDSKGQKTTGHELHLFGRMDKDFWFGQGRPDANGTIALRIPHGLQQVKVRLMTNEHGALRYRRGPDKPLENPQLEIDFGTLNDDVHGLEIIRYKAPIALIKPVDEEGKPIAGATVQGTYPWGKQRYVLDGETRSDIHFERQDDGRFRTGQMLPGEEVTFTANAQGYEPASEKLTLSEGETKDLMLTLKKAMASKHE
jgi:beta-lactamase regulating signal transducer with metallopeptidase domain